METSRVAKVQDLCTWCLEHTPKDTDQGHGRTHCSSYCFSHFDFLEDKWIQGILW